LKKEANYYWNWSYLGTSFEPDLGCWRRWYTSQQDEDFRKPKDDPKNFGGRWEKIINASINAKSFSIALPKNVKRIILQFDAGTSTRHGRRWPAVHGLVAGTGNGSLNGWTEQQYLPVFVQFKGRVAKFSNKECCKDVDDRRH
jgi:hypothetical protein